MSIGQVKEGELEQRLGLGEMARSWSPRVISKLENAIRSYQDDDLYRFNPVRYAIQTGMAESEAIALFLHATRSSLFTMEWQLVCSGCGHLVESLGSVGNCILITATTSAFPRTKPPWMISSTARLL